MVAAATLITALAALITALAPTKPLAGLRGWLRDRTTRYDRMIAAMEQREDAERLIRHVYEGLEGVQRPFDRDALMGDIRRYHASRRG